MSGYATFIRPMLCETVKDAFDDPDWIFEIKWDGYRAIAEIRKGKLKFYSRNGISLAERYPSIARQLLKIKHDLVLDGEVVALDEQGRARFQLLQGAAEHNDARLRYYVFDLLSQDGRDLRALPLLERKRLLRRALPRSAAVLYCDHMKEKGKDFFAVAAEHGLEGIIAKNAKSTYRTGVRSRDWLKIKNLQEEEVIIGGYTEPRGSRSHFGALLLGMYEGRELRYVGHVGTGFDERALAELSRKMRPLVRRSSPFADRVRPNAPITWLKPSLVANVRFTERTSDGLLRHPVFLGLRFDKAAKEVVIRRGRVKRAHARSTA